ncbi:phosphoribosyltransferase [Nitrosophilus kaiyonis]|uniref:phosphoribosyltransferase n=1 Tax=Nitrosophilus kaiyonis TaxID=2930200 RepID=UPI0024939837|nr:phosphoribosyltransferase family protein [Nitrosophilus kaiyonis]
MKREYYSYNEFIKDLKILIKKIDFDFDAIVAIARGGMTIAHLLGEYYDIRDVFTINSIGYKDTKKLENIKIFNIPDLKKYRKILLVDDIIDSGETIKEVTDKIKEKYPDIKIKVASIFYKKDAVYKPDFFAKYANNWIDFFWSIDLKAKNDIDDR